MSAGTVVIGGGVVGTCVAGFLAEAGEAVTILDHGHAAGSTSNAGSLHVQMQSRFMRLHPEAVPAMEAQLPLYPLAVRFWRDLLQRLDIAADFALTGGLMVAESEEQLAFLATKAKRERTLGLDVEMLGRDDVARVAPYLSHAIVGAELCRDEGKLDPLLANAGLGRWAAGLGVVRRDGCHVAALTPDGAGYRLITDAGPIDARRVVLAAGWGCGALLRPLGLLVPTSAEPLHLNITEAAAPLIGHLVQHADRMITLKQLAAGQVVIGGGWPALPAAGGQAPALALDSLIAGVTLAQHVVPALGGLRLLRSWAGNNTVVDGRGVLGAVPGRSGLYVAIPGDAGYTLGPLAARMVVDAVLGRPSQVDLTPYRPDRFAGA